MMLRLMDRVALLFLIFIYLFNAEPYENIAFSLTWLSLKASILISKACLPQPFCNPFKVYISKFHFIMYLLYMLEFLEVAF